MHYVCGTLFQISGDFCDILNLFIGLGFAVLRKHLKGDYG